MSNVSFKTDVRVCKMELIEILWTLLKIIAISIVVFAAGILMLYLACLTLDEDDDSHFP
jgi:hypothetical protein